ncbi:switch-associated protein 70-like [Haliotis asinina]|uniref:switch-associated protein 70-like n=1 Tax=Haliotis asinina TaxID=109174 RepID=UPI00353259DC
MATTGDIQKSLWHAFNALDVQQTGIVQKSRLKVLTNNIGRVFDLEKAEELLDNVEYSTPWQSLTFTQFYEVIENNLLFQLNGNLSSSSTSHILEQIDNICWMLCETKYMKKNNNDTGQVQKFYDKEIFKLVKVFNFCVEVNEDDGKVVFPLTIDVEEAQHVCNIMSRSLGLSADRKREFSRKGDNPQLGDQVVDFPAFLDGLEACFHDLSAMDLSQGVHEVHDMIIGDTLKKGHMVKFGNRLTSWKERWFVLTAQELRYFTGCDERELKGAIDVSKSCKVEPLPDKIGTKTNRFILNTSGKQYELSAPDLKSRNEWISAIQKAIDHSYASRDESIQRLSWWERRKERATRRKEVDEEAKRRKEEQELMLKQQKELEEEKERNNRDRLLLEQHLQELEAERQARAEIEAQLREQAALREAEQQRLKELEEIRQQMEKLLEEERQAKRDEEIVRNLQARILEEEFEKRAELEKLKEQQDQLLEEERRQRAGMEKARQESDHQLIEARDRLKELELEGKQAESQLLEATSKLRLAEEERVKLEARLKVKESKTIGLARPMCVPDPDPFTTHRGKGAFVEADFQAKTAHITPTTTQL